MQEMPLLKLADIFSFGGITVRATSVKKIPRSLFNWTRKFYYIILMAV
jgi:hypothetical protein